MKKLVVLIMAAIMLAFVGSAQGLVEYDANFDASSEGWNDGVETAVWYSTDGQDGGGFHTNSRPTPYGAYLTPPSTSILFGNVASNFENELITFSYYLKDISDSITTIPLLYVFADVDGGGWDLFWSYEPKGENMLEEWGGIPKEWTRYAYTIDPTAVEAPEGWTPNNTSYTWAESWQHITSWNFMSSRGTGSPNISGIDTFLVTNDPNAVIIPAPDIPGDANLDGKVDADDAATLAANWLQSGKLWADGDFNDDGIVDDKDATLMAANWGNGVQMGSSVPEPGTVGLLLTALASLTVGLFSRRKN